MRLNSIGVPWIKAKVDTGAQTSALHATEIVEFDRDGAPWVRFKVQPWQADEEDPVAVELPVHDQRLVRSSSGHAESRPVVLVTLGLAGRELEVELTLTDREEMVFRMLIGREALQQGFVVDPGASFLGGKPPRLVRRLNRGQA